MMVKRKAGTFAIPAFDSGDTATRYLIASQAVAGCRLIRRL
jgi:hypothetical protein